MPSFDDVRDARVSNLVRLFLEIHGKKLRDAHTIEELVSALAKGLEIEDRSEPTYTSLVAEARERLAFEVPQFLPPPAIGLDGDHDGGGGPNEPPNWIKDDHEWPLGGLWQRYRRWLLGRFSPDKVDALDRTTDNILRHLGNPGSPREHWKLFGACIGQVQSGKTGTYVGLLAKAIDAGYVNVIVLSGLHNNLRSQTQIRVDEGLVGKTNYDGKWEDIGVGLLPGDQKKVVRNQPFVLTNAQDSGDFSAQAQGWRGSETPNIMVIKKNVLRLRQVREEMVADQETYNPRYSQPTIIVDDEADQASVNSKAADSPTAINKEIRLLMDLFDRASYVGFTATPFANIFIDPDASFDDVKSRKKIPDLYPRDLIRLIPPSAEYFGPRQMLAYEGNGPRLTARADDYQSWLVPKHKKEHIPGPVPESLKDALASFMIGAAIKRLRRGGRGEPGFDWGMNEHTTMLVHVTRFTKVQDLVRDQVRDEFALAKSELLGGSAAGPWHKRLQAQYDEIVEMGKGLSESLDRELAHWLIGRTIPFSEALEHLRTILNQFEIEVVNGEVSDALRYRKSRERLIIAVGGDKLSRGLTLEGLTISYYLRNAGNWDTLMQMGRWFGYRERYLDLCRIFLPSDLEVAYEEVLEATVDLEDQLRRAAVSGEVPLNFCLTLLSSSLGKLPTGRMGNQRRTYQMGGYGNSLLQKRTLPIDPETKVFKDAREAFEGLLSNISSKRVEDGSGADGGMLLFKDVSSKHVRDFIVRANLPQSGSEEDASGIAEYLEEHEANGRLTEWTVAIPNVGRYPEWDKHEKIQIGTHQIGPSRRGNQGGGDGLIAGMPGYRRIVTLIGPAHEGAGLTEAQLRDGGILGRNATGTLPDPEEFRRARLINHNPVEGLLLIYPVVNSRAKPTNAGQPDHPWTVAWAMSLPPIAEDAKRERFVPQATHDFWARTRRLLEEDKPDEVDEVAE